MDVEGEREGGLRGRGRGCGAIEEGGDWRVEDPYMYKYLITTCLYTGWLREHGFVHCHRKSAADGVGDEGGRLPRCAGHRGGVGGSVWCVGCGEVVEAGAGGEGEREGCEGEARRGGGICVNGGRRRLEGGGP